MHTDSYLLIFQSRNRSKLCSKMPLNADTIILAKQAFGKVSKSGPTNNITNISTRAQKTPLNLNTKLNK